MPVNWNYYIKKKKIVPVDFCRKYNISSYEGLISKLNLQDVIPPKKTEVAYLFEDLSVTPEPQKQAVEKQPVRVKKPRNMSTLKDKKNPEVEVVPVPKPTRPKNTKNVSTLEDKKKSNAEVIIDENGFLVAPEAAKKKTTPKSSKRTTASRSTRRKSKSKTKS